jgi:hypothetical protein
MAPTSDMRNAQTFLVRDLAWELMRYSGPIAFTPSISALTVLQTDSPPAFVPTPNARPRIAKSTEPKRVTDKPLMTTYSVSGYDLWGIHTASDCDHGAPLPCLEVLLGTSPVALPPEVFSVSTNNVATLTLPQDRLKDVKSIRFRVRHAKDPERLTEWTYPLKASENKPAPSPPYLHVGDSMKVTFTGADFSQIDPKKITFENQAVVGMPAKDGKSLDVYVTSIVTQKSGHKELIAGSSDPNGKAMSLPIDIVR